jgi:hypothetical protein
VNFAEDQNTRNGSISGDEDDTAEGPNWDPIEVGFPCFFAKCGGKFSSMKHSGYQTMFL